MTRSLADGLRNFVSKSLPVPRNKLPEGECPLRDEHIGYAGSNQEAYFGRKPDGKFIMPHGGRDGGHLGVLPVYMCMGCGTKYSPSVSQLSDGERRVYDATDALVRERRLTRTELERTAI